jgi:hypothetical protein
VARSLVSLGPHRLGILHLLQSKCLLIYSPMRACTCSCGICTVIHVAFHLVFNEEEEEDCSRHRLQRSKFFHEVGKVAEDGPLALMKLRGGSPHGDWVARTALSGLLHDTSSRHSRVFQTFCVQRTREGA